jgi:hypothetical protein
MCHKPFIILMDNLISVLPIMVSALEAIKIRECCALIHGFIEFIKEMSEQLNKYASQSTSGEYRLC